MLSINPSELIWTILGFLMLYFLLSRFLYRPLVSFMDARRARIDAGLNEEKQAQEALEEDAERLEQARVQELYASREQLLKEKERDEDRCAETVRQARESAARLNEQGRQEADTIRAAAEQGLSQRKDELAERLAQHLLSAGNTEQ